MLHPEEWEGTQPCSYSILYAYEQTFSTINPAFRKMREGQVYKLTNMLSNSSICQGTKRKRRARHSVPVGREEA